MSQKKRVLLIIESSTGFGRGIFRGITQYVRQTNRWLINIENRGFDDPLPVWLADWPGDGIISRSGNVETLRFLQTLRRPLVELHGDGRTVFPEVSSDQDAIARTAAEHLLESGLEKIAFYSYGRAWWLDQRREAFVAHLRRRGIETLEPPPFEPDASESFAANPPSGNSSTGQKAPSRRRSSQNGRESSERSENFASANPIWRTGDDARLLLWLKKLPKPVGIFTGYDPAAIRVINACGRLGLAVPDQVAVLGAGNDAHLCEALTPTLSSVDLDPVRIGYEAAKRLDEKMGGADLSPFRRKKSGESDRSSTAVPEPILLPVGGLAARESTDVIRTDDEDIAQAIRYLRQNALTGLRVADIVERLNISAKTLQRGIRRTLGRTAEQELIRIRMTAARERLEDSRRSVAEVASLCGFSSTKYFVNAFRHYYQTTPNAYRRLLRDDAAE